ncbi:unnamed protein product [Cuscuta europaea]|uniref:Uncharacterized protein n=1 Tax=Cuscuta europaea TaxID=41803 RepID=A0A9P1A2S3_CUSEU|nr:unnamed protein product [Cuscuta europaea]
MQRPLPTFCSKARATRLNHRNQDATSDKQTHILQQGPHFGQHSALLPKFKSEEKQRELPLSSFVPGHIGHSESESLRSNNGHPCNGGASAAKSADPRPEKQPPLHPVVPGYHRRPSRRTLVHPVVPGPHRPQITDPSPNSWSPGQTTVRQPRQPV